MPFNSHRLTPARRRQSAVALLPLLAGVAWTTFATAQSRRDTPFGDAQWIAGAVDMAASYNVVWTPTRGAWGAHDGPFPLLRKEFAVPAGRRVTRATLAATALGSYRLTINGQPVSDAVLTPGWTDYRKRVEYQTYDVTALVRSGANAIGAMLGDGWFGSPIGDNTYTPYAYAPPPVRLRSTLTITFADGGTETIASDTSWRSTAGPILSSQIYAGETYDARALPLAWDRPGFDDRAWLPVAVVAPLEGLAIEPQEAPPIRRVQTLIPRARHALAPDTAVYDLGQNIAGWARIAVHGPAGATVQLQHAEVLAADTRHLWRGNLAGAAAIDTYILSGSGEETYEPHFTYHGFRYVQIVTAPGVVVDSVVGMVVHTDAPETATFASSNSKLDRLVQNIQWSLRGNLMSVPTDCPQRNERKGWTGDAQIFWPTAVYLMDLRTFTPKWLQDLRDTQSENPSGCFPMYSPNPYPWGVGPWYAGGVVAPCGGPGWSDAGVLVALAAYRQYGDTAFLRTHWGAMERYMAYVADSNPDFLWVARSRGWGDWMPAGQPGPRDHTTGMQLLATAFWAADAEAMREMAYGLGDRMAETKYARLYDEIRAAFQRAYVGPGGTVGQLTPATDTTPARLMTSQTSYVLALQYGLVPDSLRAAAARHLVEAIAAHDGHLATGFLGTPNLLPVLSDAGYDDVAYQLVLAESLPSWLYMVDRGATTMWETWDADQKNDYSFNHYAYGAVGGWLLRDALGIAQDSGSAGFRRIVIRPHPDPKGRLTHLTGTYQSVVGEIVSAWTLDPRTGLVALEVRIPPHTVARVDVPVRQGSGWRWVAHAVGAGTHRFSGR